MSHTIEVGQIWRLNGGSGHAAHIVAFNPVSNLVSVSCNDGGAGTFGADYLREHYTLQPTPPTELDLLQAELAQVKQERDAAIKQLHCVKMTLNKLGAATFHSDGVNVAVAMQPFERIEWLDAELRKLSRAPVRPEPSRLEIAAMLMAGMVANPGCPELFLVNDLAESVIGMTDTLIAEARKEVAK